VIADIAVIGDRVMGRWGIGPSDHPKIKSERFKPRGPLGLVCLAESLSFGITEVTRISNADLPMAR